MSGPDNTQFNCDVLAIGAHPDDIEHGIGGTLLHLKDQGKKIRLLHLTHGEAGTYGSREKRDEEARAAADYLGAEVRWLGLPDTAVENTRESRMALVREIRDARPRLVLSQYYHFPLFHPDHEACGSLVRDCFRLSRYKNVDTGNEPFWIPNVCYYLLPYELRPSFIVDVSPYWGRWLELANLYGSQLDFIPKYRERLESHKRMAGVQIDSLYGEAFYCDRPLKGSAFDFSLA